MFIDIYAHAYLYPSPPQDGSTQFPTPDAFKKIARENALKIFNLPFETTKVK